jgi:hypothetical protein
VNGEQYQYVMVRDGNIAVTNTSPALEGTTAQLRVLSTGPPSMTDTSVVITGANAHIYGVTAKASESV